MRVHWSNINMETFGISGPKALFTRTDISMIILSYYDRIRVCKLFMTQLRKKSYQIWHENVENWGNYLKETREQVTIIPSSGKLGGLLRFSDWYLYDISVNLLTKEDYDIFKNFILFVEHPNSLSISKIAMPTCQELEFNVVVELAKTVWNKLGLEVTDLPEFELEDKPVSVVQLPSLFNINKVVFFSDGILIDHKIKSFPPVFERGVNDKKSYIQIYYGDVWTKKGMDYEIVSLHPS